MATGPFPCTLLFLNLSCSPFPRFLLLSTWGVTAAGGFSQRLPAAVCSSYPLSHPLRTHLATTAVQILRKTSSQRQGTRKCPLERGRRTAHHADPTRSRAGYGGGGGVSLSKREVSANDPKCLSELGSRRFPRAFVRPSREWGCSVA